MCTCIKLVYVLELKWINLSVQYCDAAKIGLPDKPESSPNVPENPADPSSLCPFLAQGACPYGNECVYIHGESLVSLSEDNVIKLLVSSNVYQMNPFF